MNSANYIAWTHSYAGYAGTYSNQSIANNYTTFSGCWVDQYSTENRWMDKSGSYNTGYGSGSGSTSYYNDCVACCAD